MKKLLFISAFVLSSFLGLCSHVIGGQLHYTHLGNDLYEVTLTLYRDCSSDTEFDDPVSIGAFNSDGDLVENLEIDLSDAIITDVEPESYSACFIAPLGLCIEEGIFTGTVTLPSIPGGYTLTYQRCCRNFSIVNVPTGTDVGITLTTTIPGSDVADENSNLEFLTQPPFVICLNAPFSFDHSAIDSDGDIITYELCAPLNTNVNGSYINPPGAPDYPELTYFAGYSANYPLDANPAFAIDYNTGLLTGTATALGQYVLGICMTEWRDGIAISTTNRDIQLNVTTCDPIDPPVILDQEDTCSGLTVQFENGSDTDMIFHWDFGVDGLESDTSNVYAPAYTYDTPGTYDIMLIANPGLPCADTAYSTYFSSPALLPAISSFSFDCSSGELLYDFEASGGTNNNAEFLWDFGAEANPASSDELITSDVDLGLPGSTVTVSFSVSQDGCIETVTTTIEIPEDVVAAIEPQDTFCDGYSYSYTNESENATSYEWDFGESAFGDNSAAINPSYTYSDTGLYFVQLIANAPNMCPDTATTSMLIYGLLDPYFDDQEAQCFEGNNFSFAAEGASTDQAIYTWDFGPDAIPANSSIQNPNNIHFDQPGIYEVTLTIAENDCLEEYTSEIEVIPNPEFDVDADTLKSCVNGVAHFHDYSVASDPISYLWDFGDGTTSTASSPNHLYESTGVYDVSVLLETTSGCIESASFIFNDIVEIVAPPTAGFTLSQTAFSLLGAEVDITSTAEDAIGCTYVMSDGGISDDCDFHYSFTESGVITITQTVYSADGCTATVTGSVIISGFIFYAPNSFTPDNDGLNDHWIPEMTGIQDYHLQIYDRWGDVIFETHNQWEPWIGDVHGGDYYAQNDVYTYHVVLSDLVGQPHEFRGHIVVVRQDSRLSKIQYQLKFVLQIQDTPIFQSLCREFITRVLQSRYGN